LQDWNISVFTYRLDRCQQGGSCGFGTHDARAEAERLKSVLC